MKIDRKPSATRAVAMVGMLATVLFQSVSAQPPNATAAPAARPALSLAQAKEIAFEKNWDLLAAKSGIDAATAQLIVTKEFPNPTASWSTAYIGSHENGTTQGNGLWQRNYDTILAVNQLIEIAGKRRDRQAAARAGLHGAKARFYDAKRTLDQGVAKAYAAVLLTEENGRILNQSARLLLHEAEIAQARFKAGDLSDSDKKQIEINAEQFALQAKSAEALALQARIAVEILMAMPRPDGQFTPTGSLDELAVPPPAPAPDPRAARPDVLAAEADLRAARASLRLQQAIRVPDPTVLLQYEHQPPGGGPPDDTAGIGISFPLPLWNRNGGNIQAAQANLHQMEFAAAKVRTQMEADIAAADAQYNEAHARWLSYRDQTAPKSAQVRASVQFAYEKGGASLLDLLDAERTDNDIRLATVQAMSDTANAIADLTAARSVLTPTELEARPQ